MILSWVLCSSVRRKPLVIVTKRAGRKCGKKRQDPRRKVLCHQIHLFGPPLPFSLMESAWAIKRK